MHSNQLLDIISKIQEGFKNEVQVVIGIVDSPLDANFKAPKCLNVSIHHRVENIQQILFIEDEEITTEIIQRWADNFESNLEVIQLEKETP